MRNIFTLIGLTCIFLGFALIIQNKSSEAATETTIKGKKCHITYTPTNSSDPPTCSNNQCPSSILVFTRQGECRKVNAGQRCFNSCTSIEKPWYVKYDVKAKWSIEGQIYYWTDVVVTITCSPAGSIVFKIASKHPVGKVVEVGVTAMCMWDDIKKLYEPPTDYCVYIRCEKIVPGTDSTEKKNDCR